MNRAAIERLDNPLLAAWDGDFAWPPFADIEPSHFEPAFDVALAEHRAEIDRISTQAEAPSFDNTSAALDCSGRLLARIEPLFRNLCGAHTSPALQAVERAMAPRLAAHHAAIERDSRLFARLDALHRNRESLGLTAERRRLIERQHRDAVMAGAHLPASAQQRLAQIVERLASLSTQFAQNVLAEEQQCLWLEDEADFAGLPPYFVAAARAAAEARGRPKAGAITLSRSMVVPFLTFSQRRDLRERAFRLWKGRGASDGAYDNRAIAREIMQLRGEMAHLLGFATYADYALTDRMAGRPAAVLELLHTVWNAAKRRAAQEQAQLEALAREGGQPPLAPWDWRYYAELVRRRDYAVDDALIKPYFALENMLAAMFDCAQRLFGLRFVERPDLPRYHADVRIFEAQRADGTRVGAFLFDNFARQSKRSGAWMASYRQQSRAHGEVLPIIANHSNFTKARAGEPVLLSLDDVRTLFHEFGHGLHGLLSNVTYERLSGTRVLRDFVELPSQLFEHWALERNVLKRHALDCTTGEPIPDELIERIEGARQFNQGFETMGYTASALVDMALHGVADVQDLDIVAFERAELARLGMPEAIAPFHHLPHFQHLFAGNYAAGYYVYLWAEVLDADGFDAFIEAGDPFDAAVAERLLRYVYSSGNTIAPDEAYRAFRGRDPSVMPLLTKRGLIDEVAPV